MALGATIYVFKIDLADSDRGVYRPLELRVARHPSETQEHLLTRVLAYCLEYDEGIALSNGLFDADQPAIAVRDLTGALRVWIDIGAPEAARLHRAAKLAPRVVIYSNKDAAQLAARLGAERIHRVEAIELYAVDREWLASFAARLSRRMEFTLTVAERHLYVSLGEETLAGHFARVPIGTADAVDARAARRYLAAPRGSSKSKQGLRMANRLLPLRDLTAPLEKDAPWPGTAVSGDPHTKTWNLHTSDDGKILAGIWESTPGVWKIDYDAWEYCHLLAGRCTIAIEGKPPVELKTGDVFIVETGAKGTWTVHENLRKYYVFALGH